MPDSKLAQSDAALTQLHINLEIAPIRSFDQLNEFLQSDEFEESPFNKLSERGVESFISSMTFTEFGLGSVNYAVLETELTPSEIYKLLSLFGLQTLASTFDQARVETELDRLIIEGDEIHPMESCPCLMNMMCVTPASCAPQTGWCCVTCQCGVIPP